MKRLSHAKKRDLNEPQIVKHLRDKDCWVYCLDQPCDLLVQTPCLRRCVHLLEVKNPEGRGARLTPDQVKLYKEMLAPPVVVISPETAENALQLGSDGFCFFCRKLPDNY